MFLTGMMDLRPACPRGCTACCGRDVGSRRQGVPGRYIQDDINKYPAKESIGPFCERPGPVITISPFSYQLLAHAKESIGPYHEQLKAHTTIPPFVPNVTPCTYLRTADHVCGGSLTLSLALATWWCCETQLAVAVWG